MKLWADKYIGRRPWTYQQDSTPPQSARVIQEWHKKDVPRFIPTQNGHQNFRISIRWTFSPGAFWRVSKLIIKISKIPKSPSSQDAAEKYRIATLAEPVMALSAVLRS